MNDSEKRFNSLCFAIFNDGLGKELMKFLEEIMGMPVANPELGSNFAYYREGQNDLIRRLKVGIKTHVQHKQETENDGSSSSAK